MGFVLKQIPRVFSEACHSKGRIVLSLKTNITRRNQSISSESQEFINKYLSLAFVQADKDKDGKVSAEEMKQAINMFYKAKGSPESPLLPPFIDQMVFKGSPTLSQEEFLSRVIFSYSFLITLAEEILKMKFAKMDVDKDGKLSKEEVGNLLDELYPISEKKQLDHFMSKYDKDKDGNASLEELIEFTKKELLALKV